MAPGTICVALQTLRRGFVRGKWYSRPPASFRKDRAPPANEATTTCEPGATYRANPELFWDKVCVVPRSGNTTRQLNSPPVSPLDQDLKRRSDETSHFGKQTIEVDWLGVEFIAPGRERLFTRSAQGVR